MSYKVVYKVVTPRQEDGKYHSFRVGRIHSMYHGTILDLKYDINEETIPNIGFAMAFDNITDAIDFGRRWVSQTPGYTILKCRAKVWRGTREISIISLARGFGAILNYWKLFAAKKAPLERPPIKGTVFCKSITPVKVEKTWIPSK
jgi:hypothetical protein